MTAENSPKDLKDALLRLYGRSAKKVTPKQIKDEIHRGEKFDIDEVDRFPPTKKDLEEKEPQNPMNGKGKLHEWTYEYDGDMEARGDIDTPH